MNDEKDQELEDIIKDTMRKKKAAAAAGKSGIDPQPVISSGTAKTSGGNRPPHRAPSASGKSKAAVSENFGKNDPRDARTKKNGKKRWSKKKKAAVIITSILAVILILLIVAVIIIHIYINKINIVDDTSSVIKVSQEEAQEIEEEEKTDEPDSPQEDIDALEEAIRKNMEDNAIEIMQDENVTNILIIGSDSRGSDRGRSDSMLLVSINDNTKQVVMTSFLRDIYCEIPGYGSTRLNHAYAYGGADLLIDTLEQNFKIKIYKYVQINFDSFVDVIDAVGGVTIDVTDAEVVYVNSYLKEINSLQGYSESDSALSSGGTYNLNGRQALAYSRIRYIGTDFARTQRQRDVMEKVMEKAKDLSITEMKSLLDTLLPELTTNLTEGEIFSLILNSQTYLNYEIVSQRIPQDSDFSYLTIRGMSVIGVDFDSSISYLRKTIYDS